MIKIILGLFIFCIILFLYLHIHYHLKTSDDMEIYEIDEFSKDKMDEILDLRQPALFSCEEEYKQNLHKLSKKEILQKYSMFEVNIRESTNKKTEEAYLPLSLNIANQLFQKDKKGLYLTEGNQDFIKETGLQKNMMVCDALLKPQFTCQSHYDILMGAEGACSPFRYELNYRNYLTVTEGVVRVKLAPPKSIKYLHPENDYEHFEFTSAICPWDVQETCKHDFEKVKCMDIVLKPGTFLYIPSYWWYSIQFSANSCVSSFKYNTYINQLAILPHTIMYTLQNQNIKRKMAKKINIEEVQEPKENTADKNTSENVTL